MNRAHFHPLSGRCGKGDVENFFPLFSLWKLPLFCPHPLWTGQTMGPKEFRHFSTMFSPTAYYYDLYPSSLPRSARDPGEPPLSPRNGGTNEYEIFLRKGPAAGRHLHRLPGRLPQEFHPRSGGHPGGGRSGAAAHRLQPGYRHPHHRARRHQRDRHPGAGRPAVRRDHSEAARRHRHLPERPSSTSWAPTRRSSPSCPRWSIRTPSPWPSPS